VSIPILAAPQRAIHRFGVGLTDIIWPPRSLLSDARVSKAGTIEADLWQALDFLYGVGCVSCGVPLPDATAPESVCPVCLASKPQYRFMRAALAYDDLSKPLVLGMKHGARKDGVNVFATWMVEAAPFVRDADMIIPVPLHWTRLWSRGYNQAGWLAQAIARRTGKPYAPLALLRKRRTPSQNGLSSLGRARNVEGAFHVAGDVTDKHILLVDDVYTTGATINACAKALMRAGAASVDGVAMARVVRPSQVDVPDAFESGVALEGIGPSLLDENDA
jgi:ComF family protein